MELQFANLSFTLISLVTVFLAAFIISKISSRHWKDIGGKKKQLKLTNKIIWTVWLVLSILVIYGGVRAYGPRFTVEESRTNPNPYQAGTIKDQSPQRLTDSERVQKNRDLIKENERD